MVASNRKDLIYCEKCHKTMKSSEFYMSNNLEKYPNGILPICKKCLTMHVDNWDPSTYLPILQEIDVPYVPDEWNALLASYGKDRRKVTGMTIMGRYLSKMRLKQFKDYRWKDTEFLQELKNKKIKEALENQGKDIQEIALAIEESSFSIPQEELRLPDYPISGPSAADSWTTIPFGGNSNDESPEELGLTDEDVIYLQLRWGRSYKPSEWITLEQYYNDFTESYDIQTAGHKDTLKKLAKTSLKLDQLIDLGDIEGAQKMQRMYDSLMKAGKFTAVQNKAENGEAVDSISELVMICEKDGFIPRFYIDKPNDKIDRVLQDLQQYTRSLIMEETNIGNLIENAVKDIQLDKEREANRDADTSLDADEIEELFNYDNQEGLSEKAYTEFSNFEDALEEYDKETYEKLADEDTPKWLLETS